MNSVLSVYDLVVQFSDGRVVTIVDNILFKEVIEIDVLFRIRVSLQQLTNSKDSSDQIQRSFCLPILLFL